MSFQYYMPNVQQLIAMGVYRLPVHLTATPTFMPIHPKPTLWNVNTVAETECEEESDNDDERSLFCSNLNAKVTDEILYEVFLQAGPISKVHIPKDNTGKRRSYGFVTYKYRSSALYALRLYQGLVLYGSRLDIKWQGQYNSNGHK